MARNACMFMQYGPMAQAGCEVIIYQDRQWVGDPRLGAFIVSVDGQVAGKVPVQGDLHVEVAPGRHRVSVRHAFSWLRSSPIEIEVDDGVGVRLKADISRQLSIPSRMAVAVGQPHRFLHLEEERQ
jgi:hypothetical protein